jgi:glycosyltransferase involved in cell wall biosynthesis
MKKIIVRGPALSNSGYGEQTRFALRALRQNEDKFDIHLINTGWGNTSWLIDDNEERRWIDSILQKTIVYTQAGGQFDLSLQVTIPGEFERLAPYNVGYTAGIETTKMSAQWLQKTHLMNKIIVPSSHSKNVIETSSWSFHDSRTNQSGVLNCQTPVEAVSFPVKSTETEELNLELSTDFNFVTVAQWGPRKNLNSCIDWFVKEFKDNPDVGLVVKTQMAKNCLLDRATCQARMRELLSKHGDMKCKVYLLHGFLSEAQLNSLYQNPSIKAIVTTTHGEGFGLPLFEAAYNGLPVIATNWSSYLDFLKMPVKNKKSGKTKEKTMFSKVDYKLGNIQPQHVWENVIIAESQWAYAEEGSYRSALRKLYKDHGVYKSQAKKLQKYITEEFSSENQYSRFIKSLGIELQEEEVKVFV